MNRKSMIKRFNETGQWGDSPEYQSEEAVLMAKWAERDSIASQFRGNLDASHTNLDSQLQGLSTAQKMELMQDTGRQHTLAYKALEGQLERERLASAIAGRSKQVEHQVAPPAVEEDETEDFNSWYARVVEGKDIPSPEQKKAQHDAELERQAELDYLNQHPEKWLEMRPSDRVTKARELGITQ